MADACSRPRQPCHLVGREVNAMREPGPPVEPSAVLEIVQWPPPVELMAIAVLILGFGEVGVQSHILACGQFRRDAHQRGRGAKRRAGSERNLHHRIFPPLVIALDHPFAVGEDGVLVLDHAIRGISSDIATVAASSSASGVNPAQIG